MENKLKTLAITEIGKQRLEAQARVLEKFPGEVFSPAAAPRAGSALSRCRIRAPALCAGARGTSLPCASGHASAPAWVKWLRHR